MWNVHNFTSFGFLAGRNWRLFHDVWVCVCTSVSSLSYACCLSLPRRSFSHSQRSLQLTPRYSPFLSLRLHLLLSSLFCSFSFLWFPQSSSHLTSDPFTLTFSLSPLVLPFTFLPGAQQHLLTLILSPFFSFHDFHSRLCFLLLVISFVLTHPSSITPLPCLLLLSAHSSWMFKMTSPYTLTHSHTHLPLAKKTL